LALNSGSRGRVISKDEWNFIEWLDESTPSASTPSAGGAEQKEKVISIIASNLYNISTFDGKHLLATDKCDEVAELIYNDLQQPLVDVGKDAKIKSAKEMLDKHCVLKDKKSCTVYFTHEILNAMEEYKNQFVVEHKTAEEIDEQYSNEIVEALASALYGVFEDEDCTTLQEKEQNKINSDLADAFTKGASFMKRNILKFTAAAQFKGAVGEK
jgi:DNA integrity scanning protein DisA with diadenylate cyclase activity